MMVARVCDAILGGRMDSRNAEDGAQARIWAIAAALFLLAGAGLLFMGQGLGLRLFGLVLLGHGAKALWVGVETQFEVDAVGRRRLVRLLVLDAGVLAMLAVARMMGTWR